MPPKAPAPDLSRRTIAVLAVALLAAAPAGALRLACAGRACRDAPAAARTPFCSLPEDTRKRIAAGFRDGRSPDVIGVTADVAVGGPRARWPDTGGSPPAALVSFGGARLRARPANTTVADVAPTIARLIGLDRPHPDVRSGRPIEAVRGGRPPRLVVLVLVRAPLRSPLPEDAIEASLGSLPVDDAAVAATLGTGALPREHGITGRVLRNDEGQTVPAWSPGAPASVVAALGDHLDRAHGGRARIGMVSARREDRGLIGGTWYPGPDDDDVRVVAPASVTRTAVRLAGSGYGRNATADLLAVALDGATPSDLARIERAARRAARGRALVVTVWVPPAEGTGIPAARVARHVEGRLGPVVEEVAAGGLFVDSEAASEAGITEQQVARTLREMRIDGRPVFADAFPGIAVELGRYC
ncbi:MAG TPA: hypothetical protein VM573_07395 [Actinomycetota bacterium]|nr:hypothetical protein [Actinomycetota bacterium]